MIQAHPEWKETTVNVTEKDAIMTEESEDDRKLVREWMVEKRARLAREMRWGGGFEDEELRDKAEEYITQWAEGKVLEPLERRSYETRIRERTEEEIWAEAGKERDGHNKRRRHDP